MPTDIQLEAFVRESWKIEGLTLGSDIEPVMDLHRIFLQREMVGTIQLEEAAKAFTHGVGLLRIHTGMDVVVGNHVPPRGGELVFNDLLGIVRLVQEGFESPYSVHQRYETLHPFMDGNGRTGRMLWAWMMQRDASDLAFWNRGFLHTWYYQSLEGGG